MVCIFRYFMTRYGMILYDNDRCDPDERGFTVELADEFGDGWNAGGINAFDHFRLDSRSELMAEVIVAMDAESEATASASTASARRTYYKNTLLGGSSRTVPLCLADGEYFFSTEFHTSKESMEPGGTFSIGGRLFSESKWSFCGTTGVLADYTYVSIVDGLCTATEGWGETAAPAATPVVGSTKVPTPAPDSGGNPDSVDTTITPTPSPDGGENRGGVTSSDGDDAVEEEEVTLSNIEIVGIGIGAMAIAALAAAGGTYAQQHGWFAAAAAGGAGGAAAAGAAGGAAGGGGSAPDEFAP